MKNRLWGKVDRGIFLSKRQTLPQADPIASDRTAVILMMRFDRSLIDDIGSSMMLLSLGNERARVMVVMKRASIGTESRM